ncbi:hypothetical protein Plec18170_009707 [Paecilomyces lecythidis]
MAALDKKFTAYKGKQRIILHDLHENMRLRTSNGILSRQIGSFRDANKILEMEIEHLKDSNCKLQIKAQDLQEQLEIQKLVSIYNLIEATGLIQIQIESTLYAALFHVRPMPTLGQIVDEEGDATTSRHYCGLDTSARAVERQVPLSSSDTRHRSSEEVELPEELDLTVYPEQPSLLSSAAESFATGQLPFSP